MSVVALSPKVGASPTSVLEHDKSFGQSRTYQETNGQSSQPVKLNSPKIEASGVFEPSFSNALAHGGSAVTITKANPLLSKHVSTSSSDISVTVNQTLNTDNIVSSQNVAVLHAEPASFSLLTGPRSIRGVREGQIATVAPNDFSPLATSNGQSSTTALLTPALTLFVPDGRHISSLAPELMTGDYSPVAQIQGSQVHSGIKDVSLTPEIPNANVPEYANKQVIPSANTRNTVITDGTDNSISYPQTEQTDNQAKNVPPQKSPEERFIEMFGKADPFKSGDNEEDDQTEESKQQALAAIFTNDAGKEQTEQAEAEASKQLDEQAQAQKVQEKIAEQQRVQVAELKARDAEVKAHEHAHATVGGQYAQTPNFKYEKGVDGQRYATDGEVQIDVSIVAGDPLATINKMKQVYAAAMAPVDPSSADIRVAAEALKKMNEAKALLAEERQKQIIDLETTQTLIEADAQVENLPPLKPHTFTVTGEVDAAGNIVQPQDSGITPVSELIDRIKQGIEAKDNIQAQVSSTTVASVNEQTQSEIKDDITQPIEPPTATLAINSDRLDMGNMKPNSAVINRFDSSNLKNETMATRYYAAVAQLNQPVSSL